VKAMIVAEHGPLTCLTMQDVDDPVPSSGEVLIRVRACGVNFADGLMVKGTYQSTPDLPFSPGVEVAGDVLAVGDGVERIAPGMRVQSLTVGGGGFAEMVTVPENLVTPISDKMPYDVAAAFVVAYGTSHLALTRRANLQAGEVLVVHGAGGGVGLTAVEIGHLLGARVIATAGSDEKLALARSRGASEVINYHREDIRLQVKSFTDDRGADVVYDPVGGDCFSASFRSMAPEGRILVVGFASGTVPKLPLNHQLVKNIDVLGINWGGYKFFAPDKLRQSASQLFEWYEQGRLQPHISLRFPLEEGREAIAALQNRVSTGKVVLTMG